MISTLKLSSCSRKCIISPFTLIARQLSVITFNEEVSEEQKSCKKTYKRRVLLLQIFTWLFFCGNFFRCFCIIFSGSTKRINCVGLRHQEFFIATLRKHCVFRRYRSKYGRFKLKRMVWMTPHHILELESN